MKKLILCLGFIALFAGCKSTIPITDTQKEIVYQTVYQDRVDSIYVDKWHDVYIKGDTVFKVDSIVNYKYKYLTKMDTVFKTDTCTITKEKEVPVIVKKNRWWPVVLLLLLEIAGCLTYYFYKKKK